MKIHKYAIEFKLGRAHYILKGRYDTSEEAEAKRNELQPLYPHKLKVTLY